MIIQPSLLKKATRRQTESLSLNRQPIDISSDEADDLSRSTRKLRNNNKGDFLFLLKGKSVTPGSFILQNINCAEKSIAEIEKDSRVLEKEILRFSETKNGYRYK